jgi:hypothetical protein
VALWPPRHVPLANGDDEDRASDGRRFGRGRGDRRALVGIALAAAFKVVLGLILIAAAV